MLVHKINIPRYVAMGFYKQFGMSKSRERNKPCHERIRGYLSWLLARRLGSFGHRIIPDEVCSGGIQPFGLHVLASLP